VNASTSVITTTPQRIAPSSFESPGFQGACPTEIAAPSSIDGGVLAAFGRLGARGAGSSSAEAETR
jgi:hypothetical protein